MCTRTIRKYDSFSRYLPGNLSDNVRLPVIVGRLVEDMLQRPGIGDGEVLFLNKGHQPYSPNSRIPLTPMHPFKRYAEPYSLVHAKSLTAHSSERDCISWCPDITFNICTIPTSRARLTEEPARGGGSFEIRQGMTVEPSEQSERSRNTERQKYQKESFHDGSWCLCWSSSVRKTWTSRTYKLLFLSQRDRECIYSLTRTASSSRQKFAPVPQGFRSNINHKGTAPVDASEQCVPVFNTPCCRIGALISPVMAPRSSVWACTIQQKIKRTRHRNYMCSRSQTLLPIDSFVKTWQTH